MKTIRKTMLSAAASALVLTGVGTPVALAQSAANQTALVDYVNPLMGTDSSYRLSYGNTYPAVAVPFGMNSWTPVTGEPGSGWGYTYDGEKISGIKQTHQPSPWMNDYAAFALMAETGPVKVKQQERGSWFSHKAEVARPYSYKVYLADYDVTAEVAPTERAAQFRFTFPESDDAHILLDGLAGGSMVKVDVKNRRITGYVRNNNGGVPDNFHNYFVAEFDRDFTLARTWAGDNAPTNELAREGDHVGAVLSFKTKKGDKVHVRVAS